MTPDEKVKELGIDFTWAKMIEEPKTKEELQRKTDEGLGLFDQPYAIYPLLIFPSVFEKAVEAL